jgi:hypothetical protein
MCNTIFRKYLPFLSPSLQEGPTFFAQRKNFFVQLIFSPKNFSSILEKGNLSEQKKFWREKIH